MVDKGAVPAYDLSILKGKSSDSVSKGPAEIEISFGSKLRYLDLIQDLSENVTRIAGFDKDSCFWIGMSVREAVTNAIQHGNQLDESKRVSVSFLIASDRLVISVCDQGKGFEAVTVPDPLAEENLLKPSGRGIFYIRSFMDEVQYSLSPECGFEVKMQKKLNHAKQGVENEN